MPKSLRLMILCCVLLASRAQAQHVLVPMDDAQANHLKAYGVTFNALTEGVRAEWLINYRGGAFLLPDVPFVRRRAALDGVTFEVLTDGAVNAIRNEVADGNADAVPLEKAPRIAVYSPPNSPPWDDAVTLALRYAGIPYTRVWDDEVLGQDLAQYDWIHLFHEDFTGQLNKLYLSYRDAPWFIDQRERDLATARRHGYGNIPALKKAVAARIRAFVDRGGFLFAMCGATETLELALASQGVDIASPYSDGTPIDPDADSRMDWANAMAVAKAHIEMSAGVNA
ncbi:MAG: asparagine synthetase B, partial [Gemmatimonadaceae bacterium]